jgi:predicted kinase
MTELVITRGISGSGKSTWARQWVLIDPQHRAEVNRDHIRLMMHGGHITKPTDGLVPVLDQDTEAMVTVASQTTVRELLKRGTNVVVSDTNLPQRTARDWAKLAQFAKADFRVMDFSNVPLEICLDRNARRTGEGHVPPGVIERQYERFIAQLKGGPMPQPIIDGDSGEPHLVAWIAGLPSAYIVDIDGTVARNNGGRSPYDWSRVNEDEPVPNVVRTVQGLSDAGFDIIFMSGRMKTAACYAKTTTWLQKHGLVPYRGLYMRMDGDTRKDSIVKRELFDAYVRGKYNIVAVLDDRQQVVDMWRNELGLTCLQVAPGEF